MKKKGKQILNNFFVLPSKRKVEHKAARQCSSAIILPSLRWKKNSISFRNSQFPCKYDVSNIKKVITDNSKVEKFCLQARVMYTADGKILNITSFCWRTGQKSHTSALSELTVLEIRLPIKNIYSTLLKTSVVPIRKPYSITFLPR